MMISVNSIVLSAKDQSFSELEEEKIILNLDSGVYYSLKTWFCRKKFRSR